MSNLPRFAFLFLLFHSVAALSQIAGTVLLTERRTIPPTDAGAWTDVGVNCPAGTIALSGGVDTNALAAFEVTTLAPTFGGTSLFDQADGVRAPADGWKARLRNVSSSGLSVAVSVVCAPLANVVVAIASAGVFGGTTDTSAAGGVNASCPSGTVALGGGVDASMPGSMKVSANAPLFGLQYLVDRDGGIGPPPTGWAGYVRNEGPAGTLRVAAVCATLAGVSSVSTGAFPIAAGSVAGFGVACPAGRIALGGGVDTNAVRRNVISVATPLFGVEPQFPVNRTSAMNEAPSSWYGTQVNRSLLATTASVGVICAATQDAPADTVMVYEFYNARLGHFFRTAAAAEALAIDAGAAGPGWTRTGDDFRAYLAGSAAGQDVCRFYNPGANSHFYTAVADECAALKAPLSGWNYEGIAFRAMLPTGEGLCAAGTVPVYRMYNNGFLVNDSNHRFTTSQGNVVQLQEQGWAYEGVALCAFP